jgi:acyl carrier protein
MISEEKIKNVLSAILSVPAASIDDKFSSDTCSEWDSLKHMNLVLALEEEFQVQIPDEEVGNMTSYKIIKLVLEELSESQK